MNRAEDARRILDFLENSTYELEKLDNFLRLGDGETFREVRYFRETLSDSELLLPLLLMFSRDIVVRRTANRIFLQLFMKELDREDSQALEEQILLTMFQEQEDWKNFQYCFETTRAKDPIL